MKKFRDMTDSEKLEIINATDKGDPLELSCNGVTWYDAKDSLPCISLDYYYRIPKRQMSIDWSVLKDEYICAARDVNGHALAFTIKPIFNDLGCWDSYGNDVYICALKSYDPGTVEWDESLIWRPGFEPK